MSRTISSSTKSLIVLSCGFCVSCETVSLSMRARIVMNEDDSFRNNVRSLSRFRLSSAQTASLPQALLDHHQNEASSSLSLCREGRTREVVWKHSIIRLWKTNAPTTKPPSMPLTLSLSHWDRTGPWWREKAFGVRMQSEGPGATLGLVTSFEVDRGDAIRPWTCTLTEFIYIYVVVGRVKISAKLLCDHISSRGSREQEISDTLR